MEGNNSSGAEFNNAADESSVEIIDDPGKEQMDNKNNKHQNIDFLISEMEKLFTRVKTGDYSARLETEFESEKFNHCKDMINSVIESVDEKMTESYDASMELALGLSENFSVLNEVASGNFEVRANEDSENELLITTSSGTKKVVIVKGVTSSSSNSTPLVQSPTTP